MERIGAAEEISHRTPDGLLAVHGHHQHRRTQDLRSVDRLRQLEIELADRARPGRQFEVQRGAGLDPACLSARVPHGGGRVGQRVTHLLPVCLRGFVPGAGERLDGPSFLVSPVVDQVVERLRRRRHPAAPAKRDGQIAVPRAGGRHGQRRLDRALPRDPLDEALIHHRLEAVIQVDPEIGSAPVLKSVIKVRRPEFREATRPLMLQDHPLSAAVDRFGAEKPKPVAVGEPPARVLVRLVAVCRGTVVTRRLQRRVSRIWKPRHRVAIDHFRQ